MSDADMIWRVAAAMWKAEAVDVGAPQSVAELRTPETFLEQSEYIRTRWEKFARVAIRAIPAADARAEALKEAALDVSEGEDDKYLILKRGMYYRPNSQGYTSSPAEAGRYTLAQAVFLSHPNGPDGPRDGMSFVPVAALIGGAE